jgi:hypothetical protein
MLIDFMNHAVRVSGGKFATRAPGKAPEIVGGVL